MEEVIWEGKASLLSSINIWDIILTLLSVGIWLVVPLIKMLGLMSKSYRVTDQRIVIKEGLVSTSETEIEYFRIKDLSVSQSMMQKIFGIGNIVIQSSSMNNSRLEMKGIPNAYQLREEIRDSVNNNRKENNVRVSESI